MSFLSKIFSDPNKKYLEEIQTLVEDINNLEVKFESFSNEQIKEKTQELKKETKNLDEILPQVFALTREASKRTLKQRHFDVQLIGGIVLHQGKIAEMKTGEGKTLSATLAASLNALSGKGVHVVTVNYYLARRDMVWMGQIYDLLGLSVGCLNHQQSFIYDASYKKPDEEKDKIRDELGGFMVVEDYLRPCSRKEAYEADITYGTNNEFGFDFLRDRLVFDLKSRVQREFNFTIIDEIDSILIDEARTPLIISSSTQEAPENYVYFANVAEKLKEDVEYKDGVDYIVDEKRKAIEWTEEGQEKIAKTLENDPWMEGDFKTIHMLENAVKAKSERIFRLDKEYVIKDGEVVIVDEFTGRLMPGRRWSEGLHQAVEAKEYVRGHKEIEIKPESRTLASITFQNLFRMYDKLSGMTGTALTSAEEFDKVYKMEVIVIPTNKPMIRKDLPDRIYKTKDGKYKAVIKEIKERSQKGQPVLVGTVSVEKNEYLKDLLDKEGINYEILNAKNHEREAEIIAQAGRLGQVTVATNMAGRGVDITLGGNPPDSEKAQQIKNLGGLHVIGTERHEARRIDDQLRGRTGRQGDPGSSQFFVSLEDDLARIFAGENIKKVMEIFKFPEDMPIEQKRISKLIESAQAKIEGFNFDARNQVLEYDDVLTKHRDAFYKKREKFLEKENPEEEIEELIKNELKKNVDFHTTKGYVEEENLKNIFEEIKTIFSLNEDSYKKLEEIIHDNKLIGEKKNKIFDYLFFSAQEALKEKKERVGEENMKKIAKGVSLKVCDLLWVEHLSSMDHLRGSVGVRAYGGKDPLIEYKTEGHKMFKELLSTIDSNIVRGFFKAELQPIPKETEKRTNISELKQKIGRNEKCPCGSGKKYKKCCHPKFD